LQNNVYQGSATEFLVGGSTQEEPKDRKVKFVDQTFSFLINSLLSFLFSFSRIESELASRVTMPQTGNQTSLYNKLVITFVAIGGTVRLSPHFPPKNID